MSRKLILKIDVDTLRGTLEGVPNLIKCLKNQDVLATFLFSLGPDHTGRAIKRVFRPGFLNKVSRTSVIEHYGIKTLLYGTLLPGPDIGIKAKSTIQETAAMGFDVGIHTWDHIAWQDGVKNATEKWTHESMDKAWQRFQDILGVHCVIHGAAGWQMNDYAYQWLDKHNFLISSDCRGTHPFYPVIQGQKMNCPQIPTTLPTLDELIGLEGITENNVAQKILSLTEAPNHWPHVFTLHAELEGMRLINVLNELINGWKEQHYDFVTMTTYANQMPQDLPGCEVVWETVPGRSGTLMCQGKTYN